MNRIVVVGASLAAVHAIEALRDGGFRGEIVLVGAEPHLPYDRTPLSKEALHSVPAPAPLRPVDWYTDLGVKLKLGAAAAELRPRNHGVVLIDGAEITYDGLVIATGSTPRTVAMGDEHVASLRSIDDAVRLHDQLAGAERVAVIGAGFIGLEVAATLTELGRTVTVVEVAPAPLARVLGDEVGQWFQEFHARRGVTIRCGDRAVSVTARKGGYIVELGSGGRVDADLVVGALGAVPATDWLRSSGIVLSDGILCDRTLQTSLPNVVAAGDVARWYNPLFDEDMRVEQWTNAVEQGRHAAGRLLGAEDAYAPVPYFWSDQFDQKMRFVGRANGAEQLHIETRTDNGLVAVFVRNGIEVGALCVNTTARLPAHREAIRLQQPYLKTAIH